MLYNSTMKGKLIFVGLNPSRVPISRSKGSSYKRFHSWLDYLGLDYVSFTNLSSDPNWDFKYKSFDHESIRELLDGYTKIVAWGSKVSDYLTRLNNYEHYILPHPSGLNRLLNNPMYVESKLEGCKRYLEE